MYMRSLDTTDIPGAQSKKFGARGVSHQTKYQPPNQTLENANIGYTLNVINKQQYLGGFNPIPKDATNQKQEEKQSHFQKSPSTNEFHQNPQTLKPSIGNEMSNSQLQQVYYAQRAKQSKVIAIGDTDFNVRPQVAKFFSSQMISDFQFLSLPGCCLALQDDASPFRESIFSSIRWIQESFEISDIYIFQSVNEQTMFSKSSRNENKSYNLGLVNRCEVYLKALGTERIIVRAFIIDDQGRIEKIF